jgi:hypothetical protein
MSREGIVIQINFDDVTVSQALDAVIEAFKKGLEESYVHIDRYEQKDLDKIYSVIELLSSFAFERKL